MDEIHREDYDNSDDEISIDGGDGDEDDSDDGDEFDDHIVYLKEEMLMILNNDPSLTKLEVGYNEDGEGEDFSYFHPPGNDWLALGKAVGNNRHLLEISVDKRFIFTERLLEFLSGLSMNRSIKKLTITGWDLSVVEVRSNLIRFFNENQAFESLTIIVGDSVESMKVLFSERI